MDNICARTEELFVTSGPVIIVGSPGYLKRDGGPKKPVYLKQHECIQFEKPLTGQVVPWLLTMDGKCLDVNTAGPPCITEDDDKGNKSRSSVAALNLVVKAGIPTRAVSAYAIHHDKYIVADERHV